MTELVQLKMEMDADEPMKIEADEGLIFRLSVYDGPLDLLLALIKKNKVNIYDIPIILILEQYLDFMATMNEQNFEWSSEFIVMAAELIYIKSRMLLPQDENEPDPREELMQALIAYSKIKETASFLFNRHERYFNRFSAPAQMPVIVTEIPLYDANELVFSMKNMRLALKDAMEKKRRNTINQTFGHTVVSIEAGVVYLLRKLMESIKRAEPLSFQRLFSYTPSRSKRVATFLALLELSKSGRIVYQKKGSDYIISLQNRKQKNNKTCTDLWKG
ncbi:MAG TPA: hypothetical protein DCY74_07240 [Clostridiales bacterium]|jgi:segregation and condensation protein A|nr:hypothetical protein [Clostridiales bacterium]HCG36316.1 hypothetical protein [Clostridiales bacterium]